MNKLFWLLLAATASFYLTSFPGWFDSGEFATAAQFLGVSHPTGHPLYVLLAKLVTFLPLGSIAFRTSLLSLFSAVASAALFRSICARLGGKSSTLLLHAAAVMFFFHVSVVLQAFRTEVYAPQLLLSLLVIWLALQIPTDIRFAPLAGFVFGLSLALQPLLSFFLFPVFYPILRNRRAIALTLLFVGFGLAPYLEMPLRASAGPVLAWDLPTTWSRFWGALTGRDFQIFFHSPWSERARQDWSSAEIATLLPFPLFLFAALGSLRLWNSGERDKALLMILTLLSTMLPWLIKNFFLQNPDAHGYVLLPIVLGTILTLEAIRSFRPIWGVLILAAIFVSSGAQGVRAIPAREGELAEILSRHLDHAPPRSRIEVDSDHWLFPLWYRSFVEGRRPDVAIVGNGMLPARWYRDHLASQYGPLDTRSALSEQASRDRPFLDGYLFSRSPSPTSLRREFAQSCASRQNRDPFGTLGGVCANVILTAAVGAEAIPLLEEFLFLSPSGISCGSRAPVTLPFPLSRGRFERFLPDADSPVTQLALLYLECGQKMPALNLLHARPSDSDGRLLHAYLLWRLGRKEEGYELLALDRQGRVRSAAFALVAETALRTMDGDVERASDLLVKAEKAFGPEAEPVKLLRREIQKQTEKEKR